MGEDYIYQMTCNGMTISLFAYDEDPSKLAIHFLEDDVEDEEGETWEGLDFLITFDREAGRQLADLINRFFDGNFAPTINGINILDYAKSLLKKPESDG